MNTILTVLKKEIKTTLRDKRTLMSAIILPSVLFPVIMLGMAKMKKSIGNKESAKKWKIALIAPPENFKKEFNNDDFKLYYDFDREAGKSAVAKDSLDAMIEFTPDFSSQVEEMRSGKVNLFYKSTNLSVKNIVSKKIESLKSQLLMVRTQQLKIPQEAFTPIVVSKIDIASTEEQIGKKVGGVLPYMFIILCFMGCMYPALDLITGEKERGTMETLLTVPASRFKILLAKTITISIFGLLSAVMPILGIALGLKFLPEIPPIFLDALANMLNAKFILMLFAMLIPLTFFFSSLLSAIVIRAQSFKEAQSIVSPLMFLIIVPAMIALFPGITLDWKTVWVPILNIALATKEIMAGTILMAHYVAIVGVLVILL